jgi:WD40 repeat protein
MLNIGDKLLTAGNDKKFKTFTIGDVKAKESTGLEQSWECEVEVKDSDIQLIPKAMAYNGSTGTIYCGTKTNQILKFEMKSEESEVVVDGHDGQVWALCTSPSKPIFATGGYDRAIKVWDAPSMKCIATYEFEKDADQKDAYQFCAGAWSNEGDILVFGTEDSNLAVFTYREGELKYIKTYNIPPKSDNAEVENVSYVRFSADSKLVGVAHMDSNLYIYDVDLESGELTQWKSPLGHNAAPSNIQWSEDSKMIKSFTRDYEICHFDLDLDGKSGKFNPTEPDPDSIKWADDALIAGWDTQGLYQKGWDGTDLNDATVTSDGKLIVSGDDYGTVRLHNYPAIDPSACIEYSGHAEFVVGVEWLRDDSQLITCGGNDMAIFQWQLKKGAEKK